MFELKVNIPNKFLKGEINYDAIMQMVVAELEKHIGEPLPPEDDAAA